MIVRLVRLCFNDNYKEDFIKVFNDTKEEINSVSGCNSLELLQDIKRPNVFFTKSLWDSETDLNNYRNTDLFRNTWAELKPNFCEQPQAWSTAIIQ